MSAAGGEGAFGDGGELVERLRVLDGEVRKHFSVDLHIGFFEAVDQARIGEPGVVGGGVDPCDPESPEVAFPVLAVSVGIAKRLFNLLDGHPPPVIFVGVVSF